VETQKIREHINYVLIDYENVQPETLASLEGIRSQVILFIGANQVKIPFCIAASIQHLGSRAEYIKISANGKNAADFHIALYLGRLIELDNKGFFHIISKDKGFDSIIQHLKEKGIFACRSSSIDAMPCFSIPTLSQALNEQLQIVLRHVSKMNPPAQIKTLKGTIRAILKNNLLSSDNIDAIITELQNLGHIKISGQRITWSL